MDPPVLRKIDARRIGVPLAWAIATGLAIACVASLVRLALYKRYSLDEFAYAHSAWLVSKGQVPCRDYFEFHFPLPALLLSRFVADSPLGIDRLRWVMLASLAFTSYGMVRINRNLGLGFALSGPLLALTCPPFVFFATEIRPDALAFCFFANSLALFYPAPVTRKRALLSGALLMLALFTTQKAIIYAAPLLLVMAVIALGRRRTPLVPAGDWFVGLLAIGICIGLYLVATHSARPWYDQTLVWARYHERRYPGFAWTQYGVPAAIEAAVPAMLGIVGAGSQCYRLAQRETPRFGLELVMLLLLGSTLFSFGFARAPFPYALLPGLGMLSVFAPQALRLFYHRILGRRTITWQRRSLAALVALAVLSFGPIRGLLRAEAKLIPDNTYQRRVLGAIESLTAPDDPVYDNSGSFVARPHVGFRYYTSALDREVEANDLPVRIPRAIRASGCTACVVDVRFMSLPPPLIRFVAEHFQPYNPDLWLWGQRYAAGEHSGTFEAVRDADYFVSPESLATEGGLTLDDVRVNSPIFRLRRGVHHWALPHPNQAFQILWLPANRTVYRPQYRGTPEFSVLF